MLARAITAAIDGVSPGVLFQNNEPGVWFDPQDLKTLYQDSAGTTPVTGVEQPVGLMLDKSKGLVLGPELVTNGTFSGGSSNWTVTGTDATHIATFSGGTLRFQSDTTSPQLSVTQTCLTVGKCYKVTVVCSAYTSGSLKADTFGGAVLANAVGTKVFYATAAQVTLSITRNTSNVDLTIDSVSVQELPGYHATQSTAINRPTLSARYNMLTGTDALSTQTATTLAANYTLSFSGAGTITLSGTAAGAYSSGTSIFTATAGTLTLTVSGQVTNAQLVATEKSHTQGLTYGTELVTNGDFSNGTTGWTMVNTGTGAVNVVSGVATLTAPNTGDVARFRQSISVQSFKTYVVTGSISSLYPGASWFWVGTTVGGQEYAAWNNLVGEFRSIIFTTSETIYLSAYHARVGGTMTIDNISVREVTNVSDNRFPYQSVTSATVYDPDPTKFPWYLNHTDHWMVTPSIDATAYDKVAVFAAIRKGSDAASGMLLEQSANAATNPNAFNVYAPLVSTYGFRFFFHGSGGGSSSGALGYEAPVSVVLVGLGSIPGDLVALRVSSVAQIPGTADQVSGNCGNYPIYIGKRGGTSAPFSGRFYGAAVRFASSLPNDNVISAIEKYYAAKAGIKI